jgi:hydrogenase 3 maturation protease
MRAKRLAPRLTRSFSEGPRPDPVRTLLSDSSGRRVVVLGVGDSLRGDDGAGPLLVSKLAGRTSALLVDGGNMPENQTRPVLEARPDVLLIVDAAEWGAAPGALSVVDEAQIGNETIGTHGMSLALFLRFLRTGTPARVYLIGIQPKHKDFMKRMSAEVRRSVARLADLIAEAFPQ